MNTSTIPGTTSSPQPMLTIAASRQPFANSKNLPANRVLAGCVMELEHAKFLQDKLTHLTSRELEVLQLVADGKANKEAASKLGISIKTVEKHREHLVQKLNIRSIAGLTRYAICVGVLDNCIQMTSS